jgi:hypothetical protein
MLTVVVVVVLIGPEYCILCGDDERESNEVMP